MFRQAGSLFVSDLQSQYCEGQNQRHAIREDDRQRSKSNAVHKPEENASAHHKVHPQANIF